MGVIKGDTRSLDYPFKAWYLESEAIIFESLEPPGPYSP